MIASKLFHRFATPAYTSGGEHRGHGKRNGTLHRGKRFASCVGPTVAIERVGVELAAHGGEICGRDHTIAVKNTR